MFDVIWEVAGGPIVGLLLVGTILFLFSARRVTAVAHLVARGTVGKSAREEADPLASLSFDERVAARLKELDGKQAKDELMDSVLAAKASGMPEVSAPPRGFGRRGVEPS